MKDLTLEFVVITLVLGAAGSILGAMVHRYLRKRNVQFWMWWASRSTSRKLQRELAIRQASRSPADLSLLALGKAETAAHVLGCMILQWGVVLGYLQLSARSDQLPWYWLANAILLPLAGITILGMNRSAAYLAGVALCDEAWSRLEGARADKVEPADLEAEMAKEN